MSDKKILVADYNTRELQQLKKIFTDAGFDVVTVQDGKAALDSFEADKPDVVLLSAMLSKINGFDVCRKIKDTETGRNVPVIIATSVYKGQKYRNKALHENGASEFIEMAARLVQMKSYFLLPKSEEAERMREELTGMLVEYSACKEVAARLRGMAERAGVQVVQVLSKDKVGQLLGKESDRSAVAVLTDGFARSLQRDIERYRSYLEEESGR